MANLQAFVSVSSNPDGVEACKEIANDIEQNFKEPKLCLFFSTIQYKNQFKEMLKTFRSVVNVPLIGCTASAIMAPNSVYPHGVGVLVVSGDLEVSIGVGKNSRINPERAGKSAFRMAMKASRHEKYPNKTAIMLPSGMKFPSIPGMKSIMRLGITKYLYPFMEDMMALMGTGPAKYDEVLKGAVCQCDGKIPISGGGAFDDFKGRCNFQFMNDNVYHDSVVLMLLSTDSICHSEYRHGLKPTGEQMTVTKAKGSLAFEINGKPAWDGFKELYKIPREIENNWKNDPVSMTIYKVPAEKDAEGKYWVVAPLCVIGDAILFAKNVEETTLYICSSSGEDMLYAAKSVAEDATKNMHPAFLLVFSPVPRVMAMMEHIDKERSYIKEVVGDTPFIGIYCCAGEVYKPGEMVAPRCLNETIVISAFGKPE
ncbi:MAG: FIST N-terminal domain-containing protein [Candidatus Altiarchaeia archaeon]